LGGIAPLPLRAIWYTVSIPSCRRGAQAALSPAFGAPARPVAWQAMHTLSYTALPSAAAVAAPLAGSDGAVAGAAAGAGAWAGAGGEGAAPAAGAPAGAAAG